MKRFDLAATGIMNTFPDGDYILFTDHEAEVKRLKTEIAQLNELTDRAICESCLSDHEAAIKKAVGEEREAIVQYLVDQGTIEYQSNTDVYFITDDDIEAIRQRGKQ